MIRELTTEDLESLYTLAGKFYASSGCLKGFDPEVFKRSWTYFLGSGMGVIFVLIEHDEAVGALGGVKVPDVNSGELIASEFFWFVDEAHRGKGLYLLKSFERWAKGHGCKRITMVHLCDSMPEKVKRVYERFGYKAVEVHYIKEVV